MPAADVDDVVAITRRFGFGEPAVRDEVVDIDIPKFDDFVHHLLVVLHGLENDRTATYEVHRPDRPDRAGGVRLSCEGASGAEASMAPAERARKERSAP